MGGISDLARRRRISPARRHQPAGLHRGHALRFPHHRRSLRRPLELDGRQRFRDHRRCWRQKPQPHLRLQELRSLLSRGRPHRSEKCIRCNLCYVACNDTAHQCIDLIAKDGSVVPPHSYDIRSNGQRTSRRHAPARASPRSRLCWLPSLLQCLPRRKLHPDGRSTLRAPLRHLGSTHPHPARSNRRLGSHEKISHQQGIEIH